MNTHLRFPAARTGMAFGLPINEAMERILQSAHDLEQSANKLAKERDGKNNFGQRIAAATVGKLRPRAAIFATASKAPKAEDEGFGQQVALAVKRKVALVTRPRTGVFASASRPRTASSGSDEGFAKRVKEAAEKKSGAKQHEEYAERERERYEEQAERARQCPQPENVGLACDRVPTHDRL